ncbi:MAG: ABC transporter permease [Actinomycetia bacterium]|nr:ABC transporter permease [Actinomycetes bacterium]MCP5030236.1 ABC transporter permease [Actinomycetes bacterium]
MEPAGNRTPRSTFAPADLLFEMTLALTSRPARTMLTALGTVLGVAALVATLGLAKTAGNQIVSRFDELEATEVVVTPETGGGFSLGFGSDRDQVSVIPWDAESRLTRLNGVTAAGAKSDVGVGDRLARSVPVIDPLGQTEFQIPVIAASPGLFSSSRARLFTGRFFDFGHDDRSDPVAVLGPAAAQRLNVTRVDNTPTIFIGDEALAVIGILADTARQPELLSAIIIPQSVAQERFGLQGVEEVQIEVEIGAAELIAAQAPVALAPDSPERLRVATPPSPTRVRSSVESDVNSLFLILGGVSLLVGAIGIANVTLVSVLERTGEIGLRRALGARRAHIAVQFLSESVALGALAGLLGTSVGILTVVVISATRQWTPVLDPWLPLAAPVLGAVIGLLAGTYPAWKAAKTEPIAALRGTA